MRTRLTAGVFTAALAFGVSADDVSASDNDAESIRLGEQLYRQGLLSDGQPSEAIVQGDVVASGIQFTCVSCHRRSGLGSSEGGKQTPAVTGPILFSPIEFRRRELPEPRIIRPAYDDESLKMAIRSGVDTNGAILDLLMPRYALSDHDIDNLVAYLSSLNADTDPGVTDDTVHFATIIAGPVDEEAVVAVQNVTDRYVMDKNALTRAEDRRAENAPWHKDWHYESYRKWQFHTWTITGDASTWADQLQRAYEEQPVFAVIGGLGSEAWDPVNTFCSDMQLPCILPSTLLVPDQIPDFYTLYFNAGIDLEARVLASYLEPWDKAPGSCAVLQIHDSSSVSRRAATVLKNELAESARRSETRSLRDGQSLAEFDWRSALSETGACSAVLWLSDAKLEDLEALQDYSQLSAIYVSASLITDTMTGLSAPLRQKIRLVYPYQLQTGMRQSPRLTGWARGKKIELTHKRLQANAFYALNLTADAMQNIRSYFSRDYFLEMIEHMASRMLAKPAYDGLSLAPGQRFLSKGAYVVKLPEETGGPVIPVSDWIVP